MSTSNANLATFHPNAKLYIGGGLAVTTGLISGIVTSYEPWRIVALTTLTTLGYAFINNVIGFRQFPDAWITRKNEYSKAMKDRWVRSNNAYLNAVAWTFPSIVLPSLFSGIILAAAARRHNEKLQPLAFTAKQLAPVMIVTAIVGLALSNLVSRIAQSITENKKPGNDALYKAVCARNAASYVYGGVMTLLFAGAILGMRSGRLPVLI